MWHREILLVCFFRIIQISVWFAKAMQSGGGSGTGIPSCKKEQLVLRAKGK